MKKAVRIACVIAIALAAAACDKCGGFNFKLSGGYWLGACSTDAPKG